MSREHRDEVSQDFSHAFHGDFMCIVQVLGIEAGLEDSWYECKIIDNDGGLYHVSYIEVGLLPVDVGKRPTFQPAAITRQSLHVW